MTSILLLDAVPPAAPVPAGEVAVRHQQIDISDAADVARAIPGDVDVVFHLAAVVSGHAEADYDAGMAVNLAGTVALLDALRRLGTAPVLVFASSVAVYGGELVHPISDGHILTPQSSYGAQKAAGELLVCDASRRGFVDGRAVRLPTVTVRPGAPNKAASSFASSIIREPLAGQEAVCPVGRDTRLWVSSPRAAVANLVRAAEVPAEDWVGSRAVALPGLSVTVGEMVEALRGVAGDEAVGRIRWQPDERIKGIVGGWPYDFTAANATAMGFVRDASFADAVRDFRDGL